MQKKLIVILALALLFGFGYTACDMFDIVEGANRVKRYRDAKNITFSEADGYYIGRRILAKYFAERKPVFDRQLTRYVNAVGHTLAAVSQRPDVWSGYRFIVFKGESMSAYCLPGGFILVSTGLLQICENEDQLAAVLGHELGHARWRHPLEALKKTIVKKRKQQLAAWGANMVGGRMGNGVKLLSLVAIINWEKQLNNYSKLQELEADVYSCWLMLRAGYSPLDMLQILRKLPRGRSQYSRLHPSVERRIAAVKKEIARYPAIPLRSRSRQARYKKLVLDYLANNSLTSTDYDGNPAGDNLGKWQEMDDAE